MAVSSRALLISRFTDLSLKPPQPPPPSFSRHHLFRPLLPAAAKKHSSYVVSCLISGVDGGGVSDDFVSTRNSGFGRGFSVIANMLKRIEPLDTSIVSKGVSDSAKDSMKQTISSMLGLLPSDQFSVTVRVSKRPLDRLIVSSIVTGYTLWNAEYRISLMRNFDISSDRSKRLNFLQGDEVLELKHGETEGRGALVSPDGCAEEFEEMQLGNLSPEARSYIQRLESELSVVKQELHARKQETLQMECLRGSNNDLLEYLRSLESDMVTELSKPSSSEVKEVIHQLAQNILQKFFKDETASNFMGNSVIAETESDGESCNIVGASRDYLAKLLFWCMLLGHHLRGLENRLHLSCVVGLL